MTNIQNFHSNNFNVNGAEVKKQVRTLDDGEVQRRLVVNGEVVNRWHNVPGAAPAGAPGAAPAADPGAAGAAPADAGAAPAPQMAPDANAAAAPNLAAPPAAANVPPVPQGFSSTGDPHDTATNGQTFDNQETGVFQALSTDGSFGIRQVQTPASQVPGLQGLGDVAVNTDVRIKTSPGNFMNFNATNQVLRVNGQETPVPAAGQSINLPGGGTLQTNADGTMTVTSSSGDTVNITNNAGPGPNGQGGYLDFSGTPSPNRPADQIHGLLGANAGNKPLDAWKVDSLVAPW